MSISIIIPAINEENRIAQTIQAIKARAEYPENLQIIVSDGGSIDATVERAQKEGAEIVHSSATRRSVQMNEGAGQAKYDALYFLHADTHPPQQFDRLIKQSLQGKPEAGCFRLSFDLDHPLLNFYGWCTHFNVDLFRFGDQSLFINRSVFEKLGGFRDDYMLLEDQEVVQRIKQNHTFAILPQRVVTSARRYIKNGAFRLQCIYVGIVIFYKMGLAQKNLYAIYQKLIK